MPRVRLGYRRTTSNACCCATLLGIVVPSDSQMAASTAAASAPDSGGDHHSLDITAPTQSSSPSAQAQSPLAAMAMKVGCGAAAIVLTIVIVWLVSSHCRKRNKLRVRQVPVRTLLLSPHDRAVGIRRCSVADFQGAVAPQLAHPVSDEENQVESQVVDDPQKTQELSHQKLPLKQVQRAR